MPTIDVTVGGVLVWLAANERFNTPATNRSSTTAIRYHSAAIAYYLFLLSAYAWIATSDQPASILRSFLPTLPSGGASPPLVAAFALGSLLPRIPAIAGIDEWCRRWLQGMAAIPHEVRRLTAEIRRASFSPNDTLRQQAEAFSAELGIPPSQLDFNPGQGPRNVWTKLTVLRVTLDQWEEDRKFLRFMSTFRSEVDDVKTRYGRLIAKAKLALQMVANDPGSATDDPRHTYAANAYVTDFKDQCVDCLQAIMTLISHALLKSDVRQTARLNDLQGMGFSIRTVQPGGLAPDELILVVAIAWLIILVGFICIPGVVAAASIEELLARTGMIALVYGVAVACAVYEHEHRSRPWRPGDVRPLGRYLSFSALAAAAGLFVSAWFHALLLGGIANGFARISVVYPWFTLTFLTTLMTAICLDNEPHERLMRRVLRLLEGGGMTIAMMMVAYGVHYWLDQRLSEHPDVSGYKVPPLVGVMFISGSMGAFIGSCVPTMYRRTRRPGTRDQGRITNRPPEDQIPAVAFGARAVHVPSDDGRHVGEGTATLARGLGEQQPKLLS